MRPRETREHAHHRAIAAADARARLLAGTPPPERSEVAARYDHHQELRTMRMQDFLDTARQALYNERRAEAMIRGHETGVLPYRLDYLLARVSRGMLPAHVEVKIAALRRPITDADITVEAHRQMETRRDYIRRRYGLTHA